MDSATTVELNINLIHTDKHTYFLINNSFMNDAARLHIDFSSGRSAHLKQNLEMQFCKIHHTG